MSKKKSKSRRYLEYLIRQYDWISFTRPICVWYQLVFEKIPDILFPRNSHKTRLETLHFMLFDLLNGSGSKVFVRRIWRK